MEELHDYRADEDEGERELDADGEHVVVDATERPHGQDGDRVEDRYEGRDEQPHEDELFWDDQLHEANEEEALAEAKRLPPEVRCFVLAVEDCGRYGERRRHAACPQSGGARQKDG